MSTRQETAIDASIVVEKCGQKPQIYQKYILTKHISKNLEGKYSHIFSGFYVSDM